MEQESGSRRPANKSWLARNWVTVAAGTFIGAMAAGTFMMLGKASFDAGATDVGIGYMVLAGVSVPVCVLAALWSCRN